jgi:cytolysin (calcineurin-like family phosphatase)
MQWTNPRPGEAIHAIDVRYDAKVGNAHGLPIFLGITAGTAPE